MRPDQQEAAERVSAASQQVGAAHAKPDSTAELSARLAEAERRADEAERRLRMIEDRYQALMDASAQIAWTASAEGLVEDVPQWRAFTGQTSEQARGWGWLDALHPDDRVRAAAAWRRAAQSRGRYEAVYRVRRHDGVYRTLLASAVPVFAPDGALLEWVGFNADMTERELLQRESADRARQLETILETMVDAVFLYDVAGRVAYVNEAGRQLFGLAPDDPVLRVAPEARAAAWRMRDERGRPLRAEDLPSVRALSGEEVRDSRAVDMVATLPGGRVVRISATGAPVRDAGGTIVGAVQVFRDVTGRRELERRTHEALEALLQMAEALVTLAEPAASAAPAMTSFGTLGGTGTRRTAERLAELVRRVLGCSWAALYRLDRDSQVLHPLAISGLTPELERTWWRERHRGTPLDVPGAEDLVRRLRAGDILVADTSKAPYDREPNPLHVRVALQVPLRVGAELVGVLTLDYGPADHDYSPDELRLTDAVAQVAALVIERERLLRERAGAEAEVLALQQANHRMDEFMSVAAHELRTPVTVIKSNVQILARRVARAEREAAAGTSARPHGVGEAELLARTEKAVDRLARLVDDLLDVTRIRAGSLALRPEPTDVTAVVREAVDEQRVANPDRHVRLDVAPDALALAADIDPDRIGQVVTNYLTNALKYSQADRPVEVRVARRGDEAVVVVRDVGPGIPKDEIGRVWDLFHRVPGIDVQSGSGVGLGLGLHLCKTIVERHGGRVGVESEPGAGSTFWFALPLVRAGSADQ